MKIQIEAWENDAAIKLPELLLDHLNIDIGDEIQVNIVENKIVINRVSEMPEDKFYKALA